MEAKLYKVVRHFQKTGRKMRVMRCVSLATAQAHCASPEASSTTCLSAEGRKRTTRFGPWFDGYIELRGSRR